MTNGLKKNLANGRAGSSQAGFTFIEMLVSIAIIILISGIFFANYRAGGRGTELVNEAQLLASNIRLAQGYCLGAVDFNDAPAPGWGFLADKQEDAYYIFADMDGDGDYQEGELKKEINLPENLDISNLSNGKNSTVIIFEPPDPLTWIDKGPSNPSGSLSVTITLKDKNSPKEYNISVNKNGLVQVQ